MKTALTSLLAVLVLTPGAPAAENGCQHGDPRNANKLVAPVVREDGRLAGYAFVTPRVCFARGFNSFDFREDEHFLMDAMVRAVHRHPFVLNEDGETTDRQAALAAFREAVEQVYNGQASGYDLSGDDLRLIRP